MKVVWVLALLVLGLVGSGCCTVTQQAPGDTPQVMTLDDALMSVATSLQAMKARAPKDKVGLMPSEAEVVFKVSAVDKALNKLYVEVSAPTGAPIGGKAGAERQVEAVLDRSNTITIRFKQVLFADEKTLLATKTPEQIAALLKALDEYIVTVQ